MLQGFWEESRRVVEEKCNSSIYLSLLRIKFFQKPKKIFFFQENNGELPYEIEELIEKKMMFEIEVSKSNASLYEDNFSVSQVSTDPAFIQKYTLDTPNTQESVSLSKGKSILAEQSEVITSASEKVCPSFIFEKNGFYFT